jgi:hypothetical protein
LLLAPINWLDTRPDHQEKAMLVSDDDKLNNLLTIAYPRCEVGESLRGGYCELSGKIGFKGLVLCERHARLLEAQDRMALLEGIVLSLGLCLSSIPLRKNKGLSMVVQSQRAQAARELAHARQDLRGIKEEWSQ